MKEVENQSTEQKILLAAEEEFSVNGFSGARTAAIAEKAGVTHAMLHYYFRTKEKLFQQILADKMSRLKGMMFGTMQDCDMPLFDMVRHAVETHFDFLAANPDLPRFVLTVVQGNPDLLEFFKNSAAENYGNLISLFQRKIDSNAAYGLCRKVDAEMLLLNIVSLNVFSFAAAPLIEGLLGDYCQNPDFVGRLRENNVEMILNQLKP